VFFMSADQLKSLAWDFLDGLWNRRDMSVADQYIDRDMRPEGPMSDRFPPGPEGAKAFASAFLQGFPDVTCTLDQQEVEGDVVKSWVTYRGTQTGPLMDIPATGNSVAVPVLVRDRISGGKIIESRNEWDPDDMMRQLGVG
jgi:predicted ester cyclase